MKCPIHPRRRGFLLLEIVLALAVFGIAATRPTEVAQDIPEIARRVDYVAPMVYPSHWGPGEYDVANPNASPYEIVARSLADFQSKLVPNGVFIDVKSQFDKAALQDGGFSVWRL